MFSVCCVVMPLAAMCLQVLGKTAKPIPVMIMGVLFAHKRYPVAKYICIVLISVGVALFVFKDSKPQQKGLDTDHTFGVGEVLLVSSVLAVWRQLLE